MSSQKGFTLIEVLTVIFVITVGVTGIYALAQSTAFSSRFASYQLTASYLAQEGIEIVRSVRDTNAMERIKDSNVTWDEGLDPREYEVDYTDLGKEDPDFSTWVGKGNYLKVDDNGFSYQGSKKTRFKRKVILEKDNNNDDTRKITVVVTFDLRGEEHTIQVNETLYHWKK